MFNLILIPQLLDWKKKVRVSAGVSQCPWGASWRESSWVLVLLGEDKQVRTDRALELSGWSGMGEELGMSSGRGTCMGKRRWGRESVAHSEIWTVYCGLNFWARSPAWQEKWAGVKSEVLVHWRLSPALGRFLVFGVSSLFFPGQGPCAGFQPALYHLSGTKLHDPRWGVSRHMQGVIK